MNPSLHNLATVIEWDEKRVRELSKMFAPYVHITDTYAALVCEIVDVLGTEKPSGIQDIVVRDLLADIFDSLIESRRIIMTGRCSTAYPVARRVYESLSLMVLCAFDASVATKWHSGSEIHNSKVRQALAKHPLGETEEATRKLYRFFSHGSHPNRGLIAHRFLGEGNEFVLGSVCHLSLALITEYCAVHLSMWFWFVAVLFYYYKELIDSAISDFGRRYLHVGKLTQKTIPELDRHYERLLREEQAAYGNASAV